MKVITPRAATLFFPNTSLEYVYYEAIANSIDANADDISLKIDLKRFSDHESLKVTITDNGEGFTDRNFEKFSNIFDVEDDQHKGIGRLVFLNYFGEISVESHYNNKCRIFIFDDEFDGDSKVITNGEKTRITKLTFSKYRKGKIKKYDYVIPSRIKEDIIYHFLPRFYSLKLLGKKLKITITLSTSEENPDMKFVNSHDVFSISDLPNLKEKVISDDSSLFGYFKLLYSIDHNYTDQKVISAICADERTIPIEIISDKDFPFGYKMIFLLFSNNFDGKTDSSREKMDFDEKTIKYIRTMFIKLVSQVIKKEIPEIENYNAESQKKIQDEYPHLQGYFDNDSIGLVDKASIVNEAQTKYFNEQKELLEATYLNDDQYEKSLAFSSRVLTEYVLYRTKIIQKLKEIKKDSDESNIHDLIVPKKNKYLKNGEISDYFHNNAWVLDDKYMTYSKVLSDFEIEQIYSELGVEGSHVYNETDNGRPDLTIIFSNDPSITDKVDVVIIEFKKLGLKLAKKEEEISQLKQRARRLLEFYPEKIQRLWFYGVIDFDVEFRSSLIEDGYTKLFSNGELFYKSQPIVINPMTDEKKLADIFVLSYNAMIEDAEARNSTFLRLLKESLKKTV